MNYTNFTSCFLLLFALMACNSKTKEQEKSILKSEQTNDTLHKNDAKDKLDFSQKGKIEFELLNSSKHYDALLYVDTCNDYSCIGKGTVELYNKKSKQLIQSFESAYLYIELDEKSKKPTENTKLRYDGQSVLLFGDYNFDGQADLAIRNGNNGGYGGPSYDVYLYDALNNKFEFNKELTELASTNLGMFDVDQKRKRLIAYSKSGCCWHMTTEYSYGKKMNLIKVFELEEDAYSDPEKVKVTTRNLVNNKWVNVTEVFDVYEYYN